LRRRARPRYRKGAHNALVPVAELTVRYPFHPLIGQTFVVLGQYEHYGAPHVLVRGTGGATHLLPAWMTTLEAGGMAVMACPRLSVSRLLELREFLDGLGFALPSGGHVPGGCGHERTENQAAGAVRPGHSEVELPTTRRVATLVLLGTMLAEAIAVHGEAMVIQPREVSNDQDHG
jgi:hypothetical protein